MPLWVDLFAFAILALALAGAVFYGVVWARVRRTARAIPTAEAGLALPEPAGGWPSLCIIVPAHNEEAVIADVARSLIAQDYPGSPRIVFALDRCTDGTERILRETIDTAGAAGARAEIIAITECPADWAGKTHALWRGVQDSKGAQRAALLLFVDADTVLHPSCCRAAVALLHHRRLGMLSLMSTLTCEQWFERLIQPAAGFELVRQFPLDLVNRATDRRAFANGQFMLWTRPAYHRFGGHSLVKGELLEDLALARALNHPPWGSPAGVLMAGDMLTCRMYRDWPSFRRGWKRIYTEAARQRPDRLRLNARRLWCTGVLLPLAAALGVALGAVWLLVPEPPDYPLGGSLLVASLASLLCFAGATASVYRSQRVPLRFVPMYPLGAARVARILSEAADDLVKGRTTRWAGREYHRQVREAGT